MIQKWTQLKNCSKLSRVLMLKKGISSFFGLYLTEYKEFGLKLIYLKVDI